jgi:hypothetical protein
MALYFDRDGKSIPHTKWRELNNDPTYRILKEFDNGKVQVRLIWNGSLTLQQKTSFRETWPLFALRVMNYNAEGKLRPDPSRDGETFAYENEALNGYEEFLITWADCHIDDDGNLVEVDNHLAPPPPPDPDAPTSVLKDAPPDFGAAW